jgi:hypothetical protein
METMGAIAGVLLMIKIIMHLYLLYKTDGDFSLFDYTSRNSPKSALVGLLPCMGDVPKEYGLLKTITNILYTVAVCGIIVFLIWYNAFRKHG